jgi:ABC-type antimicrobial peptide transport system permease subunit
MELKKVGILSLAKIAGLFGIIYGLISGILLSFVYSKSDLLASLGAELPATITTLGYASIIVLPILNGIIYFIEGIILALIYNLLAGWVGGVKLEFKEQGKKK